MKTPDLKERLAGALADGKLAGSLGRFGEAYAVSRARAYEGISFEALRDRLVALKGRAAGRLEALARDFEARATEAGAKVFRTSDPEAVREYVVRLCRERGVRRVVKSKSMATEEIHLNARLEQEGVRVKETDLGEWIVQLAGQRPSHMVMPAIHLSKEQVADVFSKEVKEQLDPDIPRLVAVARRELREEFLRADLGITGANIAVAQTGTLVVVTNEGNARLVSTPPPHPRERSSGSRSSSSGSPTSSPFSARCRGAPRASSSLATSPCSRALRPAWTANRRSSTSS